MELNKLKHEERIGKIREDHDKNIKETNKKDTENSNSISKPQIQSEDQKELLIYSE